jgi:hypothetical protein
MTQASEEVPEISTSTPSDNMGGAGGRRPVIDEVAES